MQQNVDGRSFDYFPPIRKQTAHTNQPEEKLRLYGIIEAEKVENFPEISR